MLDEFADVLRQNRRFEGSVEHLGLQRVRREHVVHGTHHFLRGLLVYEADDVVFTAG